MQPGAGVPDPFHPVPLQHAPGLDVGSGDIGLPMVDVDGQDDPTWYENAPDLREHRHRILDVLEYALDANAVEAAVAEGELMRVGSLDLGINAGLTQPSPRRLDHRLGQVDPADTTRAPNQSGNVDENLAGTAADIEKALTFAQIEKLVACPPTVADRGGHLIEVADHRGRV